jgi:TonB family protein
MLVYETAPEIEEQKDPEPEAETEPEPEPETKPEPEPEVVDYQDAVVTEVAPPADAQPSGEPSSAPVFGVSMSSTVSNGSSWGLQVGNTVAIKPEDSAVVEDPAELTPVVAYQFIEREPVVIKRFEPAYPEGPKAAGIEGDVLLYLTIDEEGAVTEAKVVRGPHPELNEAARKAMFKHRFRPATKGGRNVVVERFPYQFTWIIEE